MKKFKKHSIVLLSIIIVCLLSVGVNGGASAETAANATTTNATTTKAAATLSKVSSKKAIKKPTKQSYASTTSEVAYYLNQRPFFDFDKKQKILDEYSTTSMRNVMDRALFPSYVKKNNLIERQDNFFNGKCEWELEQDKTHEIQSKYDKDSKTGKYFTTFSIPSIGYSAKVPGAYVRYDAQATTTEVLEINKTKFKQYFTYDDPNGYTWDIAFSVTKDLSPECVPWRWGNLEFSIESKSGFEFGLSGIIPFGDSTEYIKGFKNISNKKVGFVYYSYVPSVTNITQIKPIERDGKIEDDYFPPRKKYGFYSFDHRGVSFSVGIDTDKSSPQYDMDKFIQSLIK